VVAFNVTVAYVVLKAFILALAFWPVMIKINSEIFLTFYRIL
jgi:hypothetical protein